VASGDRTVAVDPIVGSLLVGPGGSGELPHPARRDGLA